MENLEAKCSQGQIPLVSVDTLLYALNVTTGLSHHCCTETKPTATVARTVLRHTPNRHLVSQEATKICLILYKFIAGPPHARLFTGGEQMNQAKSLTRRG